MRGLMAKPSGEIIETPIISNFKEGLSVQEYFNSTHGARKGLADTALKTANSGYLTRRLVDVAQDCIITEKDCGTKVGFTVSAVVDGGEVLEPLEDRILGRTALEDVLDPNSGEVLAKAGEIMNEAEVELITKANVQTVRIRSPLTCELAVGICGTCYGRDLARGTPVNRGEAVGVIAAQSIGEPGTQLTMRTFHIGGTAQVSEQSFIESNYEGTIKFVNPNALKDSSGRLIAMSRNMQLVVVDADGVDRATHKITYGTRLRVNEGDKVARGQRLAEWDPYTRPILTEVSGTVKYEDVVDGVSIKEVADEATGISQKVVIDWRASARGSDLRPAFVILDKKGEVLILPNGNEARYLLSVEAILSVSDGTEIKAGDALARIPTEGAKTRDITGGLPRVAELFEARKPKDHAVIAAVSGTVEFTRDYKNKRRIVIRAENEEEADAEYLIQKGKHLAVQEGDYIEKGEYLIDGNPAPHDILDIKGIEELAAYLIHEIQEVYRLQGVKINDKHIEVIVRQMLQKVEIEDGGDTTYLKGEQLDKVEVDESNVATVAEGGKPAQFRPVLLGITKASLQTRSFISAASFQETTRVLTEASVNGKVDYLEGLKENVIVGRLIPAGTGGAIRRFRGIATTRDAEVVEQREAEAALEAAAALPEPGAEPSTEAEAPASEDADSADTNVA